MPLSDRIGSREWCHEHIRQSLLETISNCICDRYLQELREGREYEPIRLNPNIVICPNLDRVDFPQFPYLLLTPLSHGYYLSNTGKIFVHLQGKYRYIPLDNLPLNSTEMYPLFRMIQDNYYPDCVYGYGIWLICLVLKGFYDLIIADSELTNLIDEQYDQMVEACYDCIGTRHEPNGTIRFYITGDDAYAQVIDALHDCADTVFMQITDRLPKYMP